MKFKIIFSTFVFAVMMICSVCFVGCDNKNHTYDESKQVYSQMISDNNDFFDANNMISISYSESNVTTAIASGQKNNNFTKLRSNATDSEAVYEPTLRASMMLVSTFLLNSFDSGVTIKNEKLNKLYSATVELSSAMHQLSEAKRQLEYNCAGDGFSENASTEQLRLKTYCNRLIITIDKACELANVFADIYTNDIYKAESSIREGALSSSAVNLEYLVKIANIASYYNSFYLYDINEQVKKGPQEVGNEIAINADFDWTIITEYEQIKNKKKAGDIGEEISDAEKAIISAYQQVKSYDNVFYANKNNALKSINVYRAIKNTSDLSIEEQICTDKIKEFAYDCKMISNLFTILTEKINAFNA